MTRYTRRELLAAGVALSEKSLQSAQSHPLVLESARWILVLSENGAVKRFTHKPTGLVLIEAGDDTPAYELTTPAGVENSAGAAIRMEPLAIDRGKGLRFVSEHNRKIVTMDVIEARAHGGVEFRVRIRNAGDLPITAIKYPILFAPAQLGASAEDDAILLPFLDGGVVDNPAREFKTTPGAHQTYPGRASCQVVAYYDKTAGRQSRSWMDVVCAFSKLYGATKRLRSRVFI